MKVVRKGTLVRKEDLNTSTENQRHAFIMASNDLKFLCRILESTVQLVRDQK